MAEHAPTPWTLDWGGGHQPPSIQAAEAFPSQTRGSPGTRPSSLTQTVCEFPRHDLDVPEVMETIRRIVACVNACEGIPTEALEQGVIKSLLVASEKIVTESHRDVCSLELTFGICDCDCGFKDAEEALDLIVGCGDEQEAKGEE